MSPSATAALLVRRAFGPRPLYRLSPNAKGDLCLGWGHVLSPGEKIPLPLSLDRANQLLQVDLQAACNQLREVVRVRLDQHHVDSLTTWVLHASTGQCENGSESWETSQLIQHLNADRFILAGAEFLKWGALNGRINRRAMNQRVLESQLFRTGELQNDHPSYS